MSQQVRRVRIDELTVLRIVCTTCSSVIETKTEKFLKSRIGRCPICGDSVENTPVNESLNHLADVIAFFSSDKSPVMIEFVVNGADSDEQAG